MPLENTLPVASMQSIVQMPLTFGSLFAGIGGLDLGFERAGMVCKWQVEIDEYAQRVLAKHWPAVRRWDDVRTWPQPDTEYVDCIVGGFPCQDISCAGKGAGLQGERSGLFYEVCRIVREMGPRFIVLENVSALLTRGLDQVLGTLASLGFDAEWHCIPASSVGAAHFRDRVFVIAHAIGQRVEGCEQTALSWIEAIQSIKSSGSGADLRNRSAVFEPKLCRDFNGVPSQVDRIRTLGNAVMPQVAELIARQLLASCKLGI